MRKRAPGRSLARAFGMAASTVVIAAAICAAALAIAARPAEGIGAGGLVTVGKGDGAQAIANALAGKGFIRSAFAFRLLARLEGLGSSLKAGTYRIEPGMGSRQILEEFASGKQAITRVTVPEGFTLSQIAGLLDRLGVVAKPSFIKAASSASLLAELGIPAATAEGYLFPDTYSLPLGYSAESIVRTMVKSFRDRISSIPESADLSPKDLQDRLILASIVEREYKSPEEAPLIASVFDNRLRIRMALQSCATVVYVLTERQGKPHPDVIYDRDLRIDDPYNTYEHRGLPPSPISNPGLTALRAVFYPQSSRYLYFRLVDPVAGTHHFSTSLEEHIDARNLFIKKVDD